jgi:hypothetical protein
MVPHIRGATLIPVMNPEEATIRAFIQKSKQERCIQFLANPKRRHKFTSELAHFKWLDDRFAHPIPPPSAHTAQEIASLLRGKGAGRTVHVISEDSDIDGRELDLDEALRHIWGRQIGTILSCIPGKLGYFEDEEIRSGRLLEH